MGKESMQNRKPMILVLAGPNGSGKSTITTFLIKLVNILMLMMLLLSYLVIPIQFITPQNFGSGVFFDINYINPSSASYTYVAKQETPF